MFHPSPYSLVCHHLLEKAPGGQGRATTASAQPAASPLCQVASMSIYLCICVYMCVHKCVWLCVFMYLYMCLYMYVCPHIYVCIHII